MFQYSVTASLSTQLHIFYIHFYSTALFYTAAFSSPPYSSKSPHSDSSTSRVHILSALSLQHFPQCPGTAPLCIRSSSTQLFLTFIHTHTCFFSINHSFFAHSLILSRCFFFISHSSLSHRSLLSTSPLLSAASDSSFSAQPLCSAASCPLLSVSLYLCLLLPVPSCPLPCFLLLSVVSAVPSHRKPWRAIGCFSGPYPNSKPKISHVLSPRLGMSQ